MPRPRKQREDKMFKRHLRSSQDEARPKHKAADRLDLAVPPNKSSPRRERRSRRIMASGKRAPRKTHPGTPNDLEDDSDSGVDIPFEKKDPPRPDDDDDEEDEEEEEYAVEKILAHQWKGKTLLFEVKWVGYEETTIEPEENLDGCPEELAAYYKKTGGRPERAGASKATKATKGAADSRKRSSSAHNDPKTNGRGSKRSKTSSGAEEATKFQPPKGSWEDHIIGVETVLRNDQGDLEGLIEWSSGHRSRHPARLLNLKCPQVMLRFYEANLIFTTQEDEAAPARKSITDGRGTKPVPGSLSPNPGALTKAVAPVAKMDISDDDEDDDMDTVKAVAHA